MIEQIYNYFTIEIIYFWLNLGVLPFWLILIFFPHSNLSKILTISIFPILIFSIIYAYLFYTIVIDGYDLLNNFSLYLGLERLVDLLRDKSFLILFWIHFLAVNLFCGSWIVNDGQKFNISKIIICLPLVITYFVGPLGLLIYWIIRIFYAKRISFYN